MHPDPRRLAVLGAVARAGGVLAAAELLHVTPSAVSQQIGRLEREVGVALLDRGPRGVTLTPAGRILADTADRIDAELSHAQKELAGVTGRVGGRVTVAAFTTAIRHVVAPTLTSLADSAPGIEVRVVELDGEPAMTQLRTGGVDVIVMDRDAPTASSAPTGMRDLPLLDEPWRVAVPPGVKLPRALPDLDGVPWVIGPKGSTARRALERIARSQSWRLVEAHECLEYPAALALVSAGLGWTLVPSLALPDQPGDVRSAALPGLGLRRLVLRHRTSRNEPAPAVRTVVTALIERASHVVLR